MTRFEVLHPNLVLFALVVDVAMRSRLRFLLILEEGIVQDLIVNINLAHLRLHSLPHLLLQRLGFVGLCRLLTQLADASLLNEVWKLEGDLVDASLVLQVATLLGPMPRYRHRVPDLLAL